METVERRKVIRFQIDVSPQLRVVDVYVVRTNPRTGGATKRMYRTDALRLFRLLSEASARSSAAEAYTRQADTSGTKVTSEVKDGFQKDD